MGALMLSQPDEVEMLSLWRGPMIGYGASCETNMRKILARVAAYYQMPVSLIMSDRRLRSVVFARQQVMWECRQVRRPDGTHRYSLPMIAAMLTRPDRRQMDHTTVMHGVRRHEERRAVWALALGIYPQQAETCGRPVAEVTV